MDTIFMNSKNSKTFDPRLIINFPVNINLKKSNKHVVLPGRSI